MGTTELTAEEAVRAYVEAWNTPDDTSRRNLLEQCWAQDGTHLDPLSEVHAREALAAHIGRFLRQGVDAEAFKEYLKGRRKSPNRPEAPAAAAAFGGGEAAGRGM
jgi:hypothetical protein